jgi:hypothetical protein
MKILENINKDSQLSQGIDIEKEHKDTYQMIKDYVLKNGEFPKEEDVYKSIASDHIKEFPSYYDALKDMEDGLKKEKVQESVSKDQEEAIKAFIEIHDNLDDDTFHDFVQKLGVNPHEAEEIIYKYTKELVDKLPIQESIKIINKIKKG